MPTGGLFPGHRHKPRLNHVLPATQDKGSQEEMMMTRKILAALLLTGSLMVAACNTVEGAGKDVQSAGQAVENAAN